MIKPLNSGNNKGNSNAGGKKENRNPNPGTVHGKHLPTLQKLSVAARKPRPSNPTPMKAFEANTSAL